MDKAGVQTYSLSLCIVGLACGAGKAYPPLLCYWRWRWDIILPFTPSATLSTACCSLYTCEISNTNTKTEERGSE